LDAEIPGAKRPSAFEVIKALPAGHTTIGETMLGWTAGILASPPPWQYKLTGAPEQTGAAVTAVPHLGQ